MTHDDPPMIPDRSPRPSLRSPDHPLASASLLEVSLAGRDTRYLRPGVEVTLEHADGTVCRRGSIESLDADRGVMYVRVDDPTHPHTH